MPRNVEIKASVKDVSKLEQSAQKLADSSEPVILKQEDIFFKVQTGRLKLRSEEGRQARLIFYNRPDTSAPKLSDFHITQTDDVEGLRNVLSRALGELGCVKKTRKLYLIGQTRVHLDHVEGLGNFVELEVVLKESQSVEDGQEIAGNLMKKLDIKTEDLITCAYMDMLC
jgi:predicted adenylyl cyclase CyaB